VKFHVLHRHLKYSAIYVCPYPLNEVFERKGRFCQCLNFAINFSFSCSIVNMEHSLAENCFTELTISKSFIDTIGYYSDDKNFFSLYA